MFYNLPHNPEILQAYCELDRDDRYERRLTAPQNKLRVWLGKLFDRHDDEPDKPEAGNRTDALVQAAKWGY